MKIKKAQKVFRGRDEFMELVDMKKLETAIVYLQRISEGNNPINNMPSNEDSVLNNPNVIRCMFFVKEVLEEVKRNGGYIGRKPRKSDKIEFPVEVLADYVYKEDKSISKFVGQVNELVDEKVYKKLKYQLITQWLKLHGFLQEEHSQEFNKTITMPTQKGIQLGIRAERRSHRGMEYMLVLYNRQAQEYIVQNLEKILCGEVKDQSDKNWKVRVIVQDGG